MFQLYQQQDKSQLFSLIFIVSVLMFKQSTFSALFENFTPMKNRAVWFDLRGSLYTFWNLLPEEGFLFLPWLLSEPADWKVNGVPSCRPDIAPSRTLFDWPHGHIYRWTFCRTKLMASDVLYFSHTFNTKTKEKVT